LRPILPQDRALLPTIVDVDIAPAMIDQASVHHRVGSRPHIALIHIAPKTVPAVPTHRRGERNEISANKFQRPVGRAEFVPGLCFDEMSPGSV